jgi:16S rRNA (guanine(966)-N(2))-methyltransferase RsmD
VLDLFAGTGQLGIECLSRGAKEVVFIDRSRDAVKIIKENLKACGFSAPVLQQDALSYLGACGKFDLIFVDPPYDAGLYKPVLEKINSIDILSEGGIILCESRRETEMPDMQAPYCKRKEYRYGKVKLSLYSKESPA